MARYDTVCSVDSTRQSLREASANIVRRTFSQAGDVGIPALAFTAPLFPITFRDQKG